MRSVILCGGVGSRLWPLSRKNYPKQFIELYGGRSLLQLTFARMRSIMPDEQIFFSTNKEHYYNVLHHVREISPNFPETNIFAEPAGKNTFPAVVFSIAKLHAMDVPEDDPVMFLPSDAYVGDEQTYTRIIADTFDVAREHPVIIGVTPNYPETGYGYIETSRAPEGRSTLVRSFTEKPDRALAEEYVSSGVYLWNIGHYTATIAILRSLIHKYQPEAAQILERGPDYVAEKFPILPTVSIDRAITEQSNEFRVLRGNFGWSDVGSFDAVAQLLIDKGLSHARHVGLDSTGIFAHSATDRLIATLGVEDLIIVDNYDSILVQKRGRGSDVGALMKMVEEKGYPEVEHILKVYRPWGWYQVLIDTPLYKVKKIVVYPKAKLSLQSHMHRAEHWVVVRGIAKATSGENELLLKENESAYIPATTRHRLENPGKISLELIEVQTGNYLGEDDILRYDDIYKR